MQFLYARKFRHARRGLSIAGLLLASIVLAGPLTYDEDAHLALNKVTHRWAALGDQVLGFDVTLPRQNIFSLARDIGRTMTIVDHGEVLNSHILGLASWLGRGAIYNTADVLRWFNIPLTARQARSVNLCASLDKLRGGTPVVIQPDPWQYGIASWYGPGFQGRLAASGEIYNMYEMTAAHKTLPLGSVVRVVSQRTGNSVVVRINDRGPYVGGRVIDLSLAAKNSLDMEGIASIYIERIVPGALDVPCE